MIVLVVAAAGEISWTPEIFYGLAAVLQLVVLLIAFRIMDVSVEHNDFISGLCIVAATNVIAYFTSGFGMIGVLITATVLYLFLLAGSRGELGKSLVVWLLAIGVYWGGAYYVVEVEYGMQVEEIGGIPQLLLEGEMAGEGMSQEDYQRLRDG